MRTCSWQEGCAQEAYAEEALCGYHAKQAEGLIWPDPEAWRHAEARSRRLVAVLELARTSSVEEEERMGHFEEGPTVGEAFEDAAKAIDMALGRPDMAMIGSFVVAVLTDFTTGEISLVSGQSLAEGWAEKAGGSEGASQELRALVARYLREADEADRDGG